ncbi:helix-turn-helix domain-containing protein [Novosphingobium aerophilum]|uniref:helix-turn-helix domain-containing protein n=1 Tax=Novosphingobium aerophilum TaxID=2839843 RepID=UPI003FD53F06
MKARRKGGAPDALAHASSGPNSPVRGVRANGPPAVRPSSHGLASDSLLARSTVDGVRSSRAGSSVYPKDAYSSAEAASAPLAALCQGQHVTQKESRGPRLACWQVNASLCLLRSGLSQPVSIVAVADVCRLSLCYFIRAFTETIGTSPYAWLLERRIEKSCTLMQETTLPLAQIALECGFGDQSHLTKAFAKRVGMTPGRWRHASERARQLASNRDGRA